MDIAYMILFLVVILIMGLILYLKNKEVDKKFNKIEKTLVYMMQEEHHFKKNVEDFKENFKNFNHEELSKRIDIEIETKISPIIKSLNGLNEILKDKLSSSEAASEEIIILAYKNGKKPIEIADEYNISISRVEFVLKLNRLI